jgi:hypothetical protein
MRFKTAEPVTFTEAPSPNKDLAGKYRSVDAARYPIGDDLELVYSKGDHSRRILPRRQADLLERCQEFRTLDQHAQVLCCELENRRDQMEVMLSELVTKTLPPCAAKLLTGLREYARKRSRNPQAERIQFESVKGQLAELIAARLLVSDADLVAWCKQAGRQEESLPRIASVGVVTKDRPESLRRCLESYIENCKRHGRENDFVVMDDSESAGLRNDTRQMLRELRDSHKVEMSYAGFEEKSRFAEALIAEAGAPPEVVKFALFDTEKCGHSTGANRNALLLHTAGDMVFSADDDTVCQVGTTWEAGNRLALCSSQDPRDMCFFSDHAAALNSVFPVDVDILGAHELLLGHKIGEYISTHSGTSEISIDQLDHQFVRGALSESGKVLVTINGLVGDSGIGWPTRLLWLEGKSREQFTRSESAYRNACKSRSVLRAVRFPTISNSPFCMTTFIGLDNRALLPPFVPVLKNEDGLFGSTVRKCFDNSYYGYIPWVLHHTPVEPRSYSANEIWKYSGWRMSHFIRNLVTTSELNNDLFTTEDRTRAFGDQLVNLGSMQLPEFMEVMRLHFCQGVSQRIVLLEQTLASHGNTPDYWAKDVRKHIAALRCALSKDDFAVPQDLLEYRSADHASQLARRLVLMFGQLLCWWPQIIKAAKVLRSQGHRLGRPL